MFNELEEVSQFEYKLHDVRDSNILQFIVGLSSLSSLNTAAVETQMVNPGKNRVRKL